MRDDDRIAQLEARIADLELALRGDDWIPYTAMGLSKMQARLLAVLMDRQIMSRDAAMLALYGLDDDDRPLDKIIDAYLPLLRKRLAAGGVTVRTKHGVGWFLDKHDKYKVRNWLNLQTAGTS